MMITLKSIKAAKVMGCPGSFGIVAEAVVVEDGEEVYLTYYNYDMEVYAVSKCSLYGFLAEDGAKPEAETSQEYTSLAEARKDQKYGEAFVALWETACKVGKGI